MPTYVVYCFGPPSELKIKVDDFVRVDGWQNEESILAKEITNPARNGPTCKCGDPQAIRESSGLPKFVTVKGYVTRITYSDPVAFEIQAKEPARLLR